MKSELEEGRPEMLSLAKPSPQEHEEWDVFPTEESLGVSGFILYQ